MLVDIVRHGLDEEIALYVEAALIDALGLTDAGNHGREAPSTSWLSPTGSRPVPRDFIGLLSEPPTHGGGELDRVEAAPPDNHSRTSRRRCPRSAQPALADPGTQADLAAHPRADSSWSRSGPLRPSSCYGFFGE